MLKKKTADTGYVRNSCYFCYRPPGNKSKNLPCGQNLVTHFVRNNRNFHHTPGVAR